MGWEPSLRHRNIAWCIGSVHEVLLPHLELSFGLSFRQSAEVTLRPFCCLWVKHLLVGRLIALSITSESEMSLPQLLLCSLVKLDLLMIHYGGGGLLSGVSEGFVFADGVTDSEMSLLNFLGDFLVFLGFIRWDVAVSKVRMRIRFIRELYEAN